MATVRKIQAKLLDKFAYSEKVHRYRFKPFKRLPKFKAGQFLHLAIDPYDPSFNWPESRVFSIASSPLNPDYIDILVSVVGKFTKRMNEELKIGDNVWLKLPYGTFNFDETKYRNCVLIAGGTGISPFISFLETAQNHLKLIYLVYGVKNSNLLIVKDLILELQSKKSNFLFDIFIEEGIDKELNSQRGKINISEIVNKSLKLNNPIFFLSGPPVMINSVEKELLRKNVDKKDIIFDNWE